MRSFTYSVNKTGCNKDWDYKKLAANFQDKQGTLDDVINDVKSGYALSAGLFGGRWRSKANVIGSQWLLLDIDNSGKDENGEKCYQHQLTLDEALEHPFIKQYCALIYTTASHKPDWHKFRLVFLLPDFVQGAETVEVLTRFLMQHLPHDPACKDASRGFYGSTEATFPLIQCDVTLPQSWIDEAVVTAQLEKIEHERWIAEIEKRRIAFREQATANNWDIDQLIQQALSYIPPRSPGSNNYNECLQVLMALNSHYGAVDAEIIGEQWSPSIKGTTWNIRAKIKSFRGRSGISIGTVFYIAKQYGFKFPAVEKKSNNYGEPELELYKEYVEREKEQEKVDDYLSFKQLVGRIVKPIKKLFQGFGSPKQPVEDTTKKPIKQPEQTVNYYPGIFKTPELIKGKTLILPTEESEITAAIYEAIYTGNKDILWLDDPGVGKSYLAGLLEPDGTIIKQLIYLAADHANPTTKTIEANFHPVTRRHNGLHIDDSRQTSLGNPYQLRPQKGQSIDIPGNCPRNDLFSKIESKNINVEGTDKICENCILFQTHNCTFKEDRSNDLKQVRIRTHPDSTPIPSKYDYSKVGLIWDETNTLFKTNKSITFPKDDIDKTVSLLYQKDRSLLEELTPLFDILYQLVKGDFNKEYKHGLYGFSDSTLREILPKYTPINLLGLIMKVGEATQQDLSFLEDVDGLDRKDTRGDNAAKYASKILRRESYKDIARELDNLGIEWLFDFLQAWGIDNCGVLSYQWGKLTITKRDVKHLRLADNAKFNLYLDVTISRETLALKRGIDPEQILVMRRAKPDYSNLTVKHITGLGNINGDRSPEKQKRLVAVKQEIAEQYPDHAAIEWKQHATDNEGYHFRDGRGQNRFETKTTLAIYGVPVQNLGSLANEFQLLTGIDPQINQEYYHPKFVEYLQEHTQGEIIQEVARLRSHRKPEQQHTVYFCGDFKQGSLDFIQEYFTGCTLEKIEALNLTPDAGSKSERLRYAILQSVKEVHATGRKITQKAIASIVGITQGRLSQVASEDFGGWSKLKKILVFLLDSLYSKTNNFSGPLSEDQQWIADIYLPLLAEDPVSPEDLATTLDAVGDEQEIKLVLSRVPFHTKLLLIIKLLTHVPDEFVSLITPLIPKELILTS